MATLAADIRTRPAARSRAAPVLVSNWLLGVAGLVFLMVIVGGITRLTESGLSITRWEPFTGAMPPIGHAAWEQQFALYRQSPQYQLMNRGMSLGEYQWIFFWEWFHRLLGRVIGLTFALPLIVFAVTRRIPKGFTGRLVLLLALGGLQGTVGWWMVMSGLEGGRVNVSHIRLALHLSFALTLLAALLWTALDLRSAAARRPLARRALLQRAQVGDTTRRSASAPPPRAGGGARGAREATPLARACLAFAALLAVQILFGAFTAGLRAGHLYTTWPLMGGGLVPVEIGALGGLADAVYNPVTVQFVHRTLALFVAGSALWLAARASAAGAGWRAGALAAAVIVQFALGVLTLVHNVPVALGVMHQACAALLVAATVALAHWALAGHRARVAAA
ncbi:MAG: COX15/CtaA family protein [Sphingomonadaceae bacterium]|nr:COX15/CtaA family protein [Sphingomonadaceae bacterium]